MKLLLGVIVQNEEVFEKVRSLNFNGALTIDVRRNLKPFTAAIDEFNELRQEKILQYVKPDDEGRVQLKTGEPGYDDVIKFITELANKEIELEVKPISIDELIKGGPISNDDLDLLCDIGFAFDPDKTVVAPFIKKPEPEVACAPVDNVNVQEAPAPTTDQ
jgi:hypothetical protein